MDLAAYRIFETVATTSSMIKAAEALYLTPSAISHAISKMETHMGFPLFIREKTGVTLTNYGEELLPQVRTLLMVSNKLDEAIDLMRGVTRGTVHLGTFNSTCCSWLPHILASMRTAFPEIRIAIHEGGYADCEEGLSSGKLDIAFVHPPIPGNLSYQELIREPLFCITPKSYHPASPNQITFRELQELPLVLSDEGYLLDVRQMFIANNISPTSFHSLIDDQSIVALVEGGVGISILPRMIIEQISGNVNIFPIEGNPYRIIGVATHKSQFLTPAARILLQEICTFVSQYQSSSPSV